MRDGNSNNIVTVGSHYTTDFESSTKTFYVTVATSTSSHVHHGSGSSNKYKINGVFSPFLRLIPGITYRFDQSDSSNSGHPFRFYLDEDKNILYNRRDNCWYGRFFWCIHRDCRITLDSFYSSLSMFCTWTYGLSAFVNTSSDLVKDVSPQLGGNLDVNAKNINFGDSASSSDDRLNFGNAGTDLSIYHNGSHNRLDYSSNVYFNSGVNVLTIVSGDETYETKDFGISGSRTGTGGALVDLDL